MMRIREIRQTDDPAMKKQLTEQLRTEVLEHFEAEQTLREHRLLHLADKIKRLRAELEEHRQQREQIVTERIERWLSKHWRMMGRRPDRDRPPPPPPDDRKD